MKSTKRKKALMLAAAALLALPMTTVAQNGKGGMFGGGSEAAGSKQFGVFNPSYSNRSGATYQLGNEVFGGSEGNLNNQAFGEVEVPLGSGLFLLATAGLGYAALRGKKKTNSTTNKKK